MKTRTNTHLESTANIRSLLPDDLREWLGESVLAAAARAAAETFFWVSADDDDPPPFGGCAGPLGKLALFTYCHAAGIFSTSEMEARLADDETLRQMCADAHLPAEKLRLFRGHNSELIKLSLIRVLEQAWAAKFGETATSDDQANVHRPAAALRDFFHDEASRRFRRGIQLDRWSAEPRFAPSADTDFAACGFPDPARIVAAAHGPCARQENRTAPSFHEPPIGARTALSARIGSEELADKPSVLLARVALWFALLLLPLCARAEDFFPTLIIGGKTNTNVSVVRANPAEIIVMFDGGGSALQRSNLPPELQAKYPYDHEAAKDYEKQRITAARAMREQQRASVQAALDRQEIDIQARIRVVERQLAALQRELDVLNASARGKPNSAARQQADRLRLIKLDYIRRVDQLRDQLEEVRTRQMQYR